MSLPPPPLARFDAVVFAGGGCRCFWQGGFWEVVSRELPLSPRIVIGVSAGAAFACAALTGRTTHVLRDFKHRVAENERNVYPRNVLSGASLFPHERIYRGTIEDAIDDDALEALRSGPDLRVAVARPPRLLGARTGVSAAAFAHALDRRAGRVHARWGARFGFQQGLLSVRDCDSTAALADLILESSCVPPLLPLYRRNGRIVLDGGLVDNAPADRVGSARSTLVLLSAYFPADRIPAVAGRTYAHPSRPISILEFDYTNPDLVQQTYDLGRRDGEAFVGSVLGSQRPVRTAVGSSLATSA